MLSFILSIFSIMFIHHPHLSRAFNNSTEALTDTPASHGPAVWCRMQPNGRNCGGESSNKFYYDIKMEDCLTAVVGSCKYSGLNAYSSLKNCRDTCREKVEYDIPWETSPLVFCRLQPDFGKCHTYHQRYYFNVTNRECRGFSYSGCGGNRNRFTNIHECTSSCMFIINE